MAARIITITNLTNQVIPVLVNSAPAANSASDLEHSFSGQVPIAPHKDFAVEERRLDVGQLESLKRKKLISFVVN